jgi:hypothetical protein
MALLQTPSAHEFVYLDNAVVVIDGMTSVGESLSAEGYTEETLPAKAGVILRD